MKRLLLTLYLFTCSAGMVMAQEYSLNLMPDVWNSNYTNPGFFPRQNFVLSLPSVHASVNTLGLNQANVFRYDGTDDIYYLNYAELLDKLDSDVTLRSSVVVDALAIGFKAKRLFLSFNANTCVDGRMTAPQDFFRTVWEGTANYVDTPLDIGPSFNLMSYQKFGMGVNYTVRPNLSVGMRVNRLIGLASFQTQRSQLAITQNSEYYQTRFQVDYLINYYAAGGIEPFDEQARGIENLSDQIGEFELEAGTSLLSNGNNGWSFDLGGEYFLNKRWSFAASVLNLGAISWKNQTQQLSLTEDYTYNGVEVSDINGDEPIDFDEISDTLETLLDFEAVGNFAYRQSLSPRTYLSARYRPASFITLGGLLYNEFGEYGTFTGLSLSSRLSLGRIFSLGGVYTLQSKAHNNFGVNTAIKLGPLQIYAIADNIAPLVNPERLDGTNFRLGMNLTFGRKKMDKQLAANLDSLDTQLLAEEPSAPKKKGKLSALFSKNKREKKEAKALADAKPRTDSLLQEELGSISSAEAVSIFYLQVNFKDSLSLEPVEAVYVDVYRLDGEGNKVLVRTGRYVGGEMDVILNASEETHELLATAFGYEPISYTFQPIPGRELKKEYLLKAESDGVGLAETQTVNTASEGNVADTEGIEFSEEEETVAEVMPVDEETEADDNTAEAQASPAEGEDKSEETDASEEIAFVEEAVELSASESELPEEELVAEEITVEEPLVEEVTEELETIAEEPLIEEVTEAPETIAEEPLVEEVEVPAVKKEKSRANNRNEPYGEEGLAFYLTERTSLRSHATSASDVLTRLAVGSEVILLEKTNDWWWYMSYKGRQGWVKAHLLEEL